LSALQGCGGSGADPVTDSTTLTPSGQGGPVEFLHGVASGDPLSDRVVMWTRVTPETAANALGVRLSVFTDEALNNFVKAVETTTDASRDFTVKIDCDGLEADTVYFYQFQCAGKTSIVGRTKTAPAPGSTQDVALGLVSCSSLAHGFFNSYDLLANRDDLDAIVHLGDYIYEYGTNEYGSLRAYEPATEIISLSDYRIRHGQYKKDPDLLKLHARYPFITIWDDHESANNSYKDGAENHNEGEGDWETRKAFALQAYDEWMPIRLPEAGNTGKIFRKISFGDMADLVLLDTRLYERTLEASTPINPASDDVNNPDRTMIGQEQFDFLIDNLRSSQANWKLVGNQVVFHQWILKPGVNNNGAPNPFDDLVAPSGLNGDAWDGYSAERQRIIDALRGSDGGAPVDDTIFLTGDVHSEWVADITDSPNEPINASGTGYNPITGEGSVATEFVVTSVTSPGLPLPNEAIQAIRVSSPHIKHVRMSDRGYSVLRLSAERAVCEYWAVSTIEQRGATDMMTSSFEVLRGTNRIASAVSPV
ncbi:MAG: alkaline phosphatase D family protein, partial [Limnobacter sp.]|nr:alkaline phosphatase D family protein [Limnobacter sp.]